MALLERFTNFASTTIVNPLVPGDTAITVTNGALFPSLSASQYFYAVLTDSINPLVPPTKREIIKVTARAGNNLTVVRGQDGTSAQSWDSLSIIELRVVAQTFTDLHDQVVQDAQTTLYSLSSPTDLTFTYDNDNNGSGQFIVNSGPTEVARITNAGELIANPSYANMKQFGADPTGVSDTLAAVTAALAAGYTKLYFPKGRYRFSSGTGIVTTNQNLMIYGDGTNASVLFTSGAAGFDLVNFTGQYTEFYSHCLVMKDIALETTCASGIAQGSGIKATMNASASVNKAPYTSVYLDNVAVGNGAYNACWAYGLRMDTCQFAKINNCFFDGFMPTAPGAGVRSGVGIDIYSRLVLNNNVKATDINITNTTVFQATVGIQINNYPDSNYNYVEGVHIDHGTVLNCTTGVRIGTTTFLSASLLPGFYLNGTHVTATDIGVDVQTVAQFFMAECLIYATGGTNFTGINFVVDATAGGYAQSIIRNNVIVVPVAYAGTIYGVNVTAADATPANANLAISGNLFSSFNPFTACVNAGANVQGVLVEPTNRYVAQDFVSITDSGSNNIMKGFNDYVGIRKTPGYPLDIKSNVSTAIRIEGGDSANNNTGIIFRGANAAADQWRVGNAVATNDATRNFDIYDNVAAANRMRIDDTGDIGFGTNTPNYKVHAVASADCLYRAEAQSGYAAVSLHASGTNPAYIFFSNVTNGERARITANNSGSLTFSGGTGPTELAFLHTGGIRFPNNTSIQWIGTDVTQRDYITLYSDDGLYISNHKSGENIYFQVTTNGAWVWRNYSGPNDRLTLTADGRLYGDALHNNASGVTGTTNQYIASGTYTPTLNNVTNVAASTAYLCQWIRVGNVVTVSGLFNIDPTAAASATELGMQLPIASNFTATSNLGGTATANGTERPCFIQADTANDRAQILWTPVGTADTAFSFTFQYTVL